MKTVVSQPVPAWAVASLILAAYLVARLTSGGLDAPLTFDGELNVLALLGALATALALGFAGFYFMSRAGAPAEASQPNAMSPVKKSHALVELEVTRVLNILRSRHTRDQAYGGSLAKVKAELAGDVSPESFKLLIEHLIPENARILDDVDRSQKELARARATIEALRHSLEKANEAALRDPLTDIGNRRSFDLHIEECIKSAVGEREDLAIIMCDVDHFKDINDRYGHPAGDEVLKFLATDLSASVRGSDIVTRHGGEEFAIILPRTKASDAAIVAERARSQIERKQLALRQSGEILTKVTASFGVTQLRIGETSSHLVRRVDSALYEAKRGGRNRVSLL